MGKMTKILLLVLILVLAFNVVYAETSLNPHVTARSSILMDRDSGRILYSHNAHTKLPEASTTKIMTALVAIEYGNLDEKVKVNNKSVGVEGSSIYLQKDEEISLRDLVYGLMLRSGNDAANAIAYHISGSVEGFCKLMNYKAKKIGAVNTNFTNPHGLHNDNHYTTAYDLALITREALKNEEFRKISSTVKWVSDRDTNKYFYNKNKTLWQYKDGDGVKIGFTKKAGRCLVSSATRENMQLIAVVLNDGNWFNDCYALLDYGFNNYNREVIVPNNKLIKEINIINGQKDTLVVKTQREIAYPLKQNEINEIKKVVNIPESIKAPIKKDQKIGTISVFLNDKLINNLDLLSNESIDAKTNMQKAIEFMKNIFN